MKIDGTAQAQVTEKPVGTHQVVGSHIYYISIGLADPTQKPNLYRMKLDGTESTKLIDDGGSTLNVAGEWIYFAASIGADKGKLYRAKLDGSEKTKLAEDERCDDINVVGDWLYYSHSKPSGGAGRAYERLKIDGTQKQPIE